MQAAIITTGRTAYLRELRPFVADIDIFLGFLSRLPAILSIIMVF
jgi:hypothetical protein